MRSVEERRQAALTVARSHAKFYAEEAKKDESYRWLADKWQKSLEILQRTK